MIGRATMLGLLLALAGGCATARPAPVDAAAPGFRADASDPRALAIADAVMERMGGRAAWDATRYLSWTFFGGRSHVWDRRTNRIRVAGTRRDDGAPYVVLMDLDDGTGRAWVGGAEVVDPAERRAMLEGARRAWVNDSYWLLMPYKLEDPGVRLRYLGVREMLDGRPADVLELTFDHVGLTPENMYHVYVGRESGLVEQWDFYRDASDDEPSFRLPWRGWTRHGSILLSGDRGEREITNIAVHDTLPDRVFETPEGDG